MAVIELNSDVKFSIVGRGKAYLSGTQESTIFILPGPLAYVLFHIVLAKLHRKSFLENLYQHDLIIAECRGEPSPPVPDSLAVLNWIGAEPKAYPFVVRRKLAVHLFFIAGITFITSAGVAINVYEGSPWWGSAIVAVIAMAGLAVYVTQEFKLIFESDRITAVRGLGRKRFTRDEVVGGRAEEAQVLIHLKDAEKPFAMSTCWFSHPDVQRLLMEWVYWEEFPEKVR